MPHFIQDNYSTNSTHEDNYVTDVLSQDGGSLELAVPFGLTFLAHWMANDGDTRLLDDLESGVSDGYERLLRYLPNREDKWPRQSYNQAGGNMFSNVVLKSLEELIVPLGLMSGAHLLQSWNDSPRYQSRGQKRSRRQQDQAGGNMNTLLNLSVPLGLTALAYSMDDRTRSEPDARGYGRSYRSSVKRQLTQSGGSSLPIIGDTTLGQWLSSNNISILSPQTLIPLGVIFVLYWAYRRYALPNDKVKLSQKPSILDLADPDDLEQYTQERGINKLDTQTPFPYALAMGPEVFNSYVQQNPGRQTQSRARRSQPQSLRRIDY